MTNLATRVIEVNEYISKLSEIKPQLDQLLEDLNLEEIIILNDGCSNKLVNRIVKYIKNHDVVAIVESKGASALNRIYGF